MTRMGKMLAVAVMLLGFGVAQAQEAVVVEHRPSAMGIVARNAIGGAVLGAAIGGGIIGYEMGIQDNSDYNWERTLAWGTGIGLAAGLVWGIVDATSSSSTYGRMGPVAPVRDGYSTTLDLRRQDQSHRELFPLVRGRF